MEKNDFIAACTSGLSKQASSETSVNKSANDYSRIDPTSAGILGAISNAFFPGVLPAVHGAIYGGPGQAVNQGVRSLAESFGGAVAGGVGGGVAGGATGGALGALAALLSNRKTIAAKALRGATLGARGGGQAGSFLGYFAGGAHGAAASAKNYNDSHGFKQANLNKQASHNNFMTIEQLISAYMSGLNKSASVAAPAMTKSACVQAYLRGLNKVAAEWDDYLPKFDGVQDSKFMQGVGKFLYNNLPFTGARDEALRAKTLEQQNRALETLAPGKVTPGNVGGPVPKILAAKVEDPGVMERMLPGDQTQEAIDKNQALVDRTLVSEFSQNPTALRTSRPGAPVAGAPAAGGSLGPISAEDSALFRKYHGGAFDPKSSMDKWKMQQLIAAKGQGHKGMYAASLLKYPGGGAGGAPAAPAAPAPAVKSQPNWLANAKGQVPKNYPVPGTPLPKV